MITDSFDRSSRELIRPEDGIDQKTLEIAKKYAIRTFILTFSSKLIDTLADKQEIVILDEKLKFGSAAGKNPVYRINGSEIGVFLCGIGATMAVGMVEELHAAFGTENFVFFGSCGVLSKIPAGKLILPTYAYRDEGVSYHYAPSCDYIEVRNADKLSVLLDEMHIDYIKGKVWTTDAFYRETENNRDKRIEDGCICVEMECSALQAVCDFRGLQLYHFLYGADSLDGTWQRRILGNLEMDSRIAYFYLAKQIAESI